MTTETLADDCPNLIGFKDGAGNIDSLKPITVGLGDRLAYIGGMPTHKLFAQAYCMAGLDTYSSAVFDFAPETALALHTALPLGNDETCHVLQGTSTIPSRQSGTERRAMPCPP